MLGVAEAQVSVAELLAQHAVLAACMNQIQFPVRPSRIT